MRQTWPECPTSPAPAVTTPHLGAHVSSKPLPAFSVLTATVLPKLGFLLLVQVLPERNRGEESNFQSSGTNTATAGDRGEEERVSTALPPPTPLSWPWLTPPSGDPHEEMESFLFQRQETGSGDQTQQASGKWELHPDVPAPKPVSHPLGPASRDMGAPAGVTRPSEGPVL